MNQIIVGGEKYNTGGKTVWVYKKMQAVMNAKPSEIFEYIGSKPGSRLSDADIVRGIVNECGMQNLCTHLYGRLHDAIAREYLMIIDNWVQKNPARAVAMELVEGSEEQPPNYTQAMSRLKNIRWRGYTPAFGGFCIKEPVVRILQLADYPIGVFQSVRIKRDEFKMPEKPSVESKTAVYSKPEDLYIKILELMPVVKKWEEYYVAACQAIETLCKKIETDVEREAT